MDPLVAWNQIKHCEYTVKFLGGERNKPSDDHSVLSFALGRAPVGEGSWEPSYPAAVGISAVYTTSTAAMHVALEMIRWRAMALESKDKDIIPDNVGYM
jgi:hypothetical protein